MRLPSSSPTLLITADRRSPMIVHVAVGRSMSKTLALLQWTFRQFGCKEVNLVHVHQPSPTIPSLLGRLPVKQVNEELVAEYRSVERKEMEKFLLSYQGICYKAQVQPKIIMTEAAHVQKGIVDLITRYCISTLVMGAAPDNCFKVKGIAGKVILTAPPFCEVWFVRKGKHLWTREASESIDEAIFEERTGSLQNSSNHSSSDSEYYSLDPFNTTQNTDTNAYCNSQTVSSSLTCENTEAPCLPLTSERNTSVCSNVYEEIELEGFYNQLQDVKMKIETSKKEAFTEQAKRKELESNIAEALNRAKAFEAAVAVEVKSRQQLQDILQTIKLRHEEIVSKKDEAMRELKNVKASITLLDGHAKEMAYRCEGATGELELIKLSIETLVERQKSRTNRKKPNHYLERWGCSSYARSPNCYKLLGVGNDLVEFTEFSALDLQTATCDFSESFKLGQGGYECVYKGEILNRTVVIKKLHLHNVQGQKEFEQEVNVLTKLRHPHLVNLIGACPELLSLVYEYLANGTLHYHLFNKTTSPLTWKARARIISEISSALLFLHSSKPERVIHGNLKPDNVFLDSDLNCKIGDFGICHFVPHDTRNYPLFHRNVEPKGVFHYTDPEYQRTGVLTLKSDVYSFGIVILQMLTGKSPLGLTSEVRRAVLCDSLSLILDTSAGEWPTDVAAKLADFGLRCSEMNGRDRPELTPEVVRELEQLHLMEERPVPPFFLCPILQEIMHDPQVAADGFTYEASALRGWLEQGRTTSPMTNLELDHLDLTPNHALRFAIQGWLCQPCQFKQLGR